MCQVLLGFKGRDIALPFLLIVNNCGKYYGLFYPIIVLGDSMIDLYIDMKDKAYRERFLRVFKKKYQDNFNIVTSKDFLYSRQVTVSDYRQEADIVYLADRPEEGKIYKYSRSDLVYEEIKSRIKQGRKSSKSQIISIVNDLNFRFSNPHLEVALKTAKEGLKILLINLNSNYIRNANSYSFDSILINHRLNLDLTPLLFNELNLLDNIYYINPSYFGPLSQSISIREFQIILSKLRNSSFDYIFLDKFFRMDQIDQVLMEESDRLIFSLYRDFSSAAYNRVLEDYARPFIRLLMEEDGDSLLKETLEKIWEGDKNLQ